MAGLGRLGRSGAVGRGDRVLLADAGVGFDPLFAGCFLGAAHFRGVDVNNRSQTPVLQTPLFKRWWKGEWTLRRKWTGIGLELAIRSQRVRLGQRELNVGGEDSVSIPPSPSHREKQLSHRLGRGMEIMTPAKLTHPDPPRNPGAFDYRGYLHRQGIHLLRRRKSPRSSNRV